MPPKYKKDDLGAGLRVSSDNIEPHPAGPPRHGELTQAERAFTLASTFLSGVLAISASQFLGAPLKLIDPAFYDGYMAYTKECFAILITCLTQWWAPTVVRVSGDESMRKELVQMKDGGLKCNFTERMVLMANHQLYTDWLYLWWIAYTNNMHGFVYIILKESLKHIPIVGWGCQFYNFIFLARNWEEDQHGLKKHLSQLNRSTNPMWLIIFPEGTNLAKSTREKSAAWAKKNGLKDMKHQLLPRSTGLRFCLQELRETTEWLYDCTIAYEGVPPGQFGQDIFTLRSSFFEGRPPKSVNMHWRKFRIDSIPINSPKAFEVWLRNRWREKDYMLEYFQRNNRFPADDFWKPHLDTSDSNSSISRQTIRSVPRAARVIETEVKSGNWNEFVKIFAPITSVMMALTVAYGASPNDLPIPGGTDIFEKLMKGMLNGDVQGLPSPDELEKMIVGAAKMGAQKEAEPAEQGEVQKLTQENLARLVKETAIQNGMVLPAGKRRLGGSTFVPQPQTTPSVRPTKPTASKAKSAVVNATSAKKPPPKSLPTPAKPKPTPTARTVTPAKPKPKTTLDGPSQTVFTKSGVAIKIPKIEVEEAKKTGTIVTKSGLVIKVGKDEIEEAQKNKGSTIMTASGVPIKISPSGAITVQPKASGGQNGPSKTGTINNAPKLGTKKAASTVGAGSTTAKSVAAPKAPTTQKKVASSQKNGDTAAKITPKKPGPQMSGGLPVVPRAQTSQPKVKK